MNSAVLSNGTVDRESTSGAALGLLPIINALEHGDGTQQSQNMASLLQQLRGLSSCWSDRDDSTGKEAACASLLSGLSRLVKSEKLLPERRERLSAVVKDLKVALIKEVFPDGTSQQASTLSKRTAAYTMLKLISQKGANMLPLLPADAMSVFQLASKAAVQPDKGNSQADGLKPGVTTRADHALPLIIGLAGAAAQIVCTAERRAAGPGPAAAAVCGTLNGSGGLDVYAEGLLGAAQWACGVLQVAIQRLTGGPPSSSGGNLELPAPSEPSAPMIRAAAHLATNACLAQLTLTTGTTPNYLAANAHLPQLTLATGTMPNMQQVGEVLECLMDLSEAVVVSAFSVLSSADMSPQRQHATVRQVFETGASILQDAPALMYTVVTLEHSRGKGAAGSSLTPPGKASSALSTSSLSTILSRLKGILVSAAALASGPPHAPTDNAASTAANGHATGDGALTAGAGAGAGSRASQGSLSTAGARISQGSTVATANGSGVGAEGSPVAAGVAGVSGADVDALWDWDLQAPLTRVTKAAPPPAAGADGASYGWAAQQFVRVAAEALCVAMEAVWKQGKQRALVHALLLLPGSGVASPNERKAIALVTGRLLVLLRGDEKLSQACLPLLMDAVTMQPLASNVEAEANQQEAAMFACFTRTIAAMAVAGAWKHTVHQDWAYEQITDLLIRLYRDHNTPGSPKGEAPDVRGACLASAITRMAEGIAAGHAPRAFQMDLQVRLLSLFSDLGMRVRAGGPGVIRAMGALLPAIAAASEGLASANAVAEQQQQQQLQGHAGTGSQSRTQSQGRATMGGTTVSSRFDHDGFAKAQKEDGARLRLLRNLWLHVALHHLAAPSATPECCQAAGRIATHTPLLLVGLDSGSPEDVAERLKVELSPRLARSGAAADPGALRASLLGTYGLSGELAGTMMPAEPAKRAHLLLVATCELARAAHAHVSTQGERSPLATTLAYLEVARAGSEDSQWFELLVRRAFERLLKNVASARATAAAAASTDVVGDATMNKHDDVEAHCAASIESLMVALIENLGNNSGHESGSPPKVAVVSESLLQKLLSLYPHMHWDPCCMLALLGMLEAEEGDKPMAILRPKASKGPSNVWKVLQGWVYAAALVAPTRTEAILHQFLGQTAPVAPLTAPTAATASSAQASAAALRRAADLLSTIAVARNKSGTSNGSTGTSDSVLALCRKQYYSGVVLGLQHMQLDEDENGPSSVKRTPFPVAARKVVKALEEAVQDLATPLPVAEERYMAATALLATSSCSLRSGSEGSEGMEYAEASGMLLRCLVDVPRRRLCSEIMPLALFAWMWTAAANSSCIIPLTDLAAEAWVETAKKGLGLFYRAHAAPQGGEQRSDDSGNSAADVSMVEGLQCHGLWLNFFDEMWDSVGDGGAATTQQSSMREIIMRMLHTSLANPDALSSHPAAAGPRFRLLKLALRLARSSAALSATVGSGKDGSANAAAAARNASTPTGWLLASLLLRDRAIQAGLAWFTHAPAFSAHLTQQESQEQHATVHAFANGLFHMSGNGWLQEAPRMKPSEAQELLASVEGRSASSVNAATAGSNSEEVVHPVWGRSTVTTRDAVNLLHMLCRFEADRLQVWTNPLAFAAQTQAAPPSYMPLQRDWEQHARTAWSISPRLAVEMAGRFPTVPTLHKEVERLVVSGAADPRVQSLPEAALMLATPEAAAAKNPALQHLAAWAPGKIVEGLQLISSPAGKHPLVKAYAARCLDNTPPAEVAFYLPQLVQSLRNDGDGTIGSALLHKAQASDMFAHQLIWALQTEEQPPREAFNPEVKRSGWEPPRDFGLWGPSSDLLKKVLNAMSPAGREYWDAENSYFEKVTGISGVLAKVEKDERKGAIAVELAKFAPGRPDLYLPTNPDCRVINHIQNSGTPMQSAAKIPILIAFQLEQLAHLVTPNLDPENREKGTPKSLACIFKVGDDVRQDVLALQVIRLLEEAFKSTGLPAYLCSYGCLPTGYERGIIEVVPNTKSRAGLGELSDKGLYDIFQAEFGMPGSPAFEAARHNFIASEAGYAIASFLLQAKDRHNGNLLISNEGHLVHIDFGFILEISPGGNMGFESAAFKLSHEMTQLLDPGANRSSATWAEFEELVVRGYLAARTVAEPIIATVALMAQSGLPCYSRGAPVDNLRRRFHLEMSEKQAAAFMRQVINDAYAKWTTGFYDYIQALQNRIPY